MYRLIIRLRSQRAGEPAFEWIYLDDRGDAHMGIASEGDDEFISIARKAQQVIVLVPGVDVLLTQVKLPKLSPAKLMKAIPFALEDQLTEDPINLHLAIGEVTKGAPLSVAVVSKEKMNEWQNVLKKYLQDAYSQVKVFLPDMLAIPYQPETFDILIDHEFAVVRTGRQSGMVIEKSGLFPVLELMLKRHGQPKPTSIQFYTTDASEVSPEQISRLNVPIETKVISKNVLTFIVKSLDTTHTLNLLQGAYAPSQKKITFEQLIWTCFALVGAWLAFLTIVNIANYGILYRERNVLDREMQSIYAAVYPQKAITDNPKLSIQKELSTLRASRADSAFMRLLTLVGLSFAQLDKQGLNLQGMSYRDNQLMLDVQAQDLSLMDRLRQSLEAQGLKVVMSNAQRAAGGLTETRFTVEEIS